MPSYKPERFEMFLKLRKRMFMKFKESDTAEYGESIAAHLYRFVIVVDSFSDAH